jgi:hypothetical protein
MERRAYFFTSATMDMIALFLAPGELRCVVLVMLVVVFVVMMVVLVLVVVVVVVTVMVVLVVVSVVVVVVGNVVVVRDSVSSEHYTNTNCQDHEVYDTPILLPQHDQYRKYSSFAESTVTL